MSGVYKIVIQNRQEAKEKEMTGDEIVTRLGQLEAKRLTWESVWEDIITYIVPRRTRTAEEVKKGERHDDKIYDGTALDALKLLADGLQGYLMSKSSNWFSLRMEDPILSDIPAIRGWLQDVERILYSLFNRSNYFIQMHEYFMDAGSFGTSTIYSQLDSARGRINFSTRHPKEIFVSQDMYGAVDQVFRRYYMSVKAIEQEFGRNALNEEMLEAFKKTPEQEFKLIHAVYPNDRRNPDKVDANNMIYTSDYVEFQHKKILRSKGYNVFPYAVWRMYKNSDEEYGRSPSWNALSETIGVNEYSKQNILAAQLANNPPKMVPSELRGKIRFVPGGMTYYGTDASRKVESVDTGGVAYPIAIDREDRKREAIRKHFMTDFFLLIAQSEKQMTATEIRERQEEKSIVLGPTINGLENECLDPIIDRVFSIALEEGWLPPPPQILEQYGGAPIKIDYLGPLAQAQRRFFTNQPYRNAFQEVFPIIQIQQGLGMQSTVADLVNWDEAASDMLEANDVPQKSIMSKEMVQAIRQQRAEAMRKQQQLDAMEKMGKVYPGLTKSIESGSLLEGAEAKAAEAMAP